MSEKQHKAKQPKNDQETEESVSSLEKDLETLTIELDESKDKYLRLFAEFDNYKKRTIKERFELMKSASQDVILSLLPILDDFDRVKKSSEEGSEPFSEGVQLVYHKLYHALESKGLKKMETTGKPFDPEFHEAITDIPAPSPEKKGSIADTIEYGYLLNDKIIRYAKVVVFN